MKRVTLLFAAIIAAVSINAAVTKIYRGNSSYVGDILYTWDGKHFYQGNTTYVGSILYTIGGKKLYKGNSTYVGDVAFTIDGVIHPILLAVMGMI